MECFAVIDTETNWYDQVMSIGVVIAERDSLEKVNDLYYILDPEYKVGGMFSMALTDKRQIPKNILLSRETAMNKVKDMFEKYNVNEIFAYNAAFDKKHLRELSSFSWFDIMRIAAYRQYNNKISSKIECCNTGRMKRDYGVEPMMRLLSGNRRYMEVHNALHDALDELEIMRLLGKSVDEYCVAKL